MKHARNDYNRIQDPSGKIPIDEPVFLVRGQDVSAPETLEFWAEQNNRNGGDKKLSNLAIQQANRMREWQKQNFCKAADID